LDASERFHQLLKRDFSPAVRADGFKGSGRTFWRVKDERIDILNIQGSKWGGQCCVNLGVHYSFLPSESGGSVTDPRKFREYDCVFRERLREAGEGDHWWSSGTSDVEAEASAASLVDTYKRRARLFYEKFEPFPDVFEVVSPARLDAGDLSQMPAGQTDVMAALTMAKIMRHIGRLDRCREFAEVGLRLIDRATGLGIGLEPELMRLASVG
jgi:hypothetical protein